MRDSDLQRIIGHGACREAVEWLKKQNSIEEAWLRCRRGDWMLWWLSRISGVTSRSRSRKQLLLVYDRVGACSRCDPNLPRHIAFIADTIRDMVPYWPGFGVGRWSLRVQKEHEEEGER